MFKNTEMNSTAKSTALLSPTLPRYCSTVQEYKHGCQSLVFVFHNPVHVTALGGRYDVSIGTCADYRSEALCVPVDTSPAEWGKFSTDGRNKTF
jgi:hypothetical protein